jgi:hypothetical protein
VAAMALRKPSVLVSWEKLRPSFFFFRRANPRKLSPAFNFPFGIFNF